MVQKHIQCTSDENRQTILWIRDFLIAAFYPNVLELYNNFSGVSIASGEKYILQLF